MKRDKPLISVDRGTEATGEAGEAGEAAGAVVAPVIPPAELLSRSGIISCRSSERFRQIGKTGFFPHRKTSVRFQPMSMAERSNLWKLTALVYEPFWRRYSTGILTRGIWNLADECDFMYGMLKPPEKGIYLDLGCSTGVYARAILSSEPESRVILLDYSMAMLRSAQKKIRKVNRTAFLQCDAAHMPFPNASFDGVVMGGTLNELAEPAQVLGEMARVMKKGVSAVVMHLVNHRRNGPSWIQKVLAAGGVWLPSPDYADALFQEAGFELKESQTAGVMRISRLKKPAS